MSVIILIIMILLIFALLDNLIKNEMISYSEVIGMVLWYIISGIIVILITGKL